MVFLILLIFSLLLISSRCSKFYDEIVFSCSYPDERLGFVMVMTKKPIEASKGALTRAEALEEFMESPRDISNTVVCNNSRSISYVNTNKDKGVCFFPVLLKGETVSPEAISTKPVCFSVKNGNAAYPFSDFNYKIDIPYHACGQFGRRGEGKDILTDCPFHDEPDHSEICSDVVGIRSKKRLYTEFCTSSNFCYRAYEFWGTDYENYKELPENVDIERMNFYTLDIAGVENYYIYDDNNRRLHKGRWVCNASDNGNDKGHGYGFGRCGCKNYKRERGNNSDLCWEKDDEDADQSICKSYCTEEEKYDINSPCFSKELVCADYKNNYNEEYAECYECQEGDETNANIPKCYKCDIEENRKNPNHICYVCTEEDLVNAEFKKCYACDKVENTQNKDHPCYVPDTYEVVFEFGYFGQTFFEFIYNANGIDYIYKTPSDIDLTKRNLGDVTITVPYTTTKVGIRYNVKWSGNYYNHYIDVEESSKKAGKIKIPISKLPILERYIQIPQDIDFSVDGFQTMSQTLNTLGMPTTGSERVSDNYLVFNSRQFAVGNPVIYASIFGDANNGGKYFSKTPLGIVSHEDYAVGQTKKTNAAFYFGMFNNTIQYQLMFMISTANTNNMSINFNCGAENQQTCASQLDSGIKNFFTTITYRLPTHYKYVNIGSHLIRIAHNGANREHINYRNNDSLLLFYNSNMENDANEKHYFYGRDITLLQFNGEIAITFARGYDFSAFVIPYINDEDKKYSGTYGSFFYGEGSINSSVSITTPQFANTDGFNIATLCMVVLRFTFDTVNENTKYKFPQKVDFSVDSYALSRRDNTPLRRFYKYIDFAVKPIHEIKALNTLYYIVPKLPNSRGEPNPVEWCLTNGGFEDSSFYAWWGANENISCSTDTTNIDDFENSYNESEDEEQEHPIICPELDTLYYTKNFKHYNAPLLTIDFRGIIETSNAINTDDNISGFSGYFLENTAVPETSEKEIAFFETFFVSEYIKAHNIGECDSYLYPVKRQGVSSSYAAFKIVDSDRYITVVIDGDECKTITFNKDIEDGKQLCFIDVSIDRAAPVDIVEQFSKVLDNLTDDHIITYNNHKYIEALGSPKEGPSAELFTYDYKYYCVPKEYQPFDSLNNIDRLVFIGKLRTFGYASLLFGENKRMDANTSVVVDINAKDSVQLIGVGFYNNEEKYFCYKTNTGTAPSSVLLRKECNGVESCIDEFNVDRFTIDNIDPIYVPRSLKESTDSFDFIAYAPVSPYKVDNVSANDRYSPFLMFKKDAFAKASYECTALYTDDEAKYDAVISQTLSSQKKTIRPTYQKHHDLGNAENEYLVPINDYEGYIMLKCTYKYNVDDEALVYNIRRIISNEGYLNWSNTIANPSLDLPLYDQDNQIINKIAYEKSLNKVPVVSNDKSSFILMKLKNKIDESMIVTVIATITPKSNSDNSAQLTKVTITEEGANIKNPITDRDIVSFALNTYNFLPENTDIYFASRYPIKVTATTLCVEYSIEEEKEGLTICSKSIIDSVNIVYTSEFTIISSDFTDEAYSFGKPSETLQPKYDYDIVEPSFKDEVDSVISSCNRIYLPLVETAACISEVLRNGIANNNKVNRQILENRLVSFNTYNILREQIGLASVWEAYIASVGKYVKKFIESQNYFYAAIEINDPTAEYDESYGQNGRYFLPHGWEVASNDEPTYIALSSFGELRNEYERCFVLSDGFMYRKDGTRCSEEMVLLIEETEGAEKEEKPYYFNKNITFDYRVLSVKKIPGFANHIVIRTFKGNNTSDDLFSNVDVDWTKEPVSNEQVSIIDYPIYTEADVEDITNSLVNQIGLTKDEVSKLQAMREYKNNDEMNVREYGRYLIAHPYNGAKSDYYLQGKIDFTGILGALTERDHSIILYTCANLPEGSSNLFDTNEIYKPNFEEVPSAIEDSWRTKLSIYVDASYDNNLRVYGLARPFDSSISNEWQCRELRIPIREYNKNSLIISASINFYYRNLISETAKDAKFTVVGFKIERDERIFSQDRLFNVLSANNKYYADIYAVNNEAVVEKAERNKFTLLSSTATKTQSVQYSINFQNYVNDENSIKMPGIISEKGLMVVVDGVIQNPTEFYMRDNITQEYLASLERDLSIFVDYVSVAGIWSHHWISKMTLTCMANSDKSNMCATVRANGILRVPGKSENGLAIRSLKSYILVDSAYNDHGKLQFEVNKFVVKEIPKSDNEVISKPSFTVKDPHFMSVNGMAFDYHKAGIYTYLNTDSKHSNVNSQFVIKAVNPDGEVGIVSDFAVSSDSGLLKVMYNGNVYVNTQLIAGNYITSRKTSVYTKVEEISIPDKPAADYSTKRITVSLIGIKFIINYMTVVSNNESHYLDIITYIQDKSSVTGGIIDDTKKSITEHLLVDNWTASGNSIFTTEEISHYLEPVYPTSSVMDRDTADKACKAIYNDSTSTGYKNCYIDAINFGIIAADDSQMVEIFKNKRTSLVDEVVNKNIPTDPDNDLVIALSVVAAVVVIALVVGLSVGLTKKAKANKRNESAKALSNGASAQFNVEEVVEKKLSAADNNFI